MGVEAVSMISVFVLLIIFIVGSVLPINIGVMGFIAAFLMGTLCGGMSLSDIYAVFPADLFVMLVGISFFFTIVQNSGAIHMLATWGLKLVRGNLGMIPWLMFLLSMFLAGIGASGIAVVSIIAPIALYLATENRMSELMMGTFIVMGVNAGSFTRLNIFGAIIEGVMESSGLSYNPTTLALNCVLYFSLISAVIFVAFGGIRLLRTRVSVSGAIMTHTEENSGHHLLSESIDLYKGIAIVSVVVLMVMVLGLGINIGFAGLILGFIISILFPKRQKKVVGSMQWGVVFMITGIMTYVGVIEELGIVDYITGLLADLNSPLLASLAVCYIGGIVSAFASTTGFLATIIPMALPIIEGSAISCVGLLSAIAVSASIVDLSPLSSAGAILMAEQRGEDKGKFYRQLLLTALSCVAFAPAIAWLVFVVI